MLHPNIILFIGMTPQPQRPVILVAFCEQGLLYKFLHSSNYVKEANLEVDEAMGEKVTGNLISGIAKGLLHIHDLGNHT